MPPDSYYQAELTNPKKAAVNKTYGADSQPNILGRGGTVLIPTMKIVELRKGGKEGILNLNLNTK